MIKKLILICTLTAGAQLSMMAQTLAPNAELLLFNRTQTVDGKAQIIDETQKVRVLIEVSDASVFDELQSMGVEIGTRTSKIATASLPLGLMREVSEQKGVVRVEAASKVNLRLDNARAASGVDQVHLGSAATNNTAYKGNGVVVGVVDNGFEYGHRAFYNADGTEYRVKRVWNQNKSGNPPAGFDYGLEYKTADEIKNGAYDVTFTYHGSHVANIAAGADMSNRYYGVAPEADLVLVSFDYESQDNTQIIDGVKYVMDYAESVNKPCVVNLSLGSHYGPHDGTSLTDRMLNELSGEGRLIVGAVGNEGQTYLHAGKKFTATSTTMKTMLKYDGTSKISAMFDAWGAVGGKFTIKCVVVDALKGSIVAQTDAVSSDDEGVHSFSFDGTSTGANCSFNIVSQVNNHNGRPNVFVQTAATSMSSNRRIGYVIQGEAGESIDLWECTGNAFTNYSKSAWTPGDNSSTMGEIGGSAEGVISVGSYNSKLSYSTLDGSEYALREGAENPLGDISMFSSQGPTLDGRMKPDVAAPGMVVVSATSSYFSATANDKVAKTYFEPTGRTYYYDINAGTSMASPLVAGTVALWLEANPKLDVAKVRDLLSRTCFHDENCDEVNNTWGYGKVNAYDGIVEVLKDAAGIGSIDAPAQKQMVKLFDSNNQVCFTGDFNQVSVAVYDALGRKVSEKNYGSVQCGQVAEMPNIASGGIYIVNVKADGYVQSMKISK